MKMKLNRCPVLIVICLFLGFSSTGQNLYTARKDSVKVPRQPYLRYFTKDGYGRNITFYLSEVNPGQKLPLVVYIQGSGMGSHFIQQNATILPANGHIYVLESLQDRARLLIVEKPGVNYLDNPAEGENIRNRKFHQEHSLERWSEAVKAAILATLRSDLADSNRVLVIGHSEGGLVACKITSDMKGLVTHVANLAGGGTSQLFDIISLTRKGNFFSHVSENPGERVTHVLDEWKKILADPLNTEKYFFGYSYLRWSSFMKTSCLEQLENCTARIFIAQGMKDEQVDPVSADQLYAHLLSKNRQVQYDRLEQADHSFNDNRNPAANGWKAEMEKIMDWFSGSK